MLIVWFCSLSNSSKRLLHQFGSSLIDKMKFRDAFAMIGEKGLEMGKALEVVSLFPHKPLNITILMSLLMYK